MVITDPNEELFYGAWAGGFRKLIQAVGVAIEAAEYPGKYEVIASWKRESSPPKHYDGADPLADATRDLTELSGDVRVLTIKYSVLVGSEDLDMDMNCSHEGHLMCTIRGADTAARLKMARRLKHFLGADFTENMVPFFHTPVWPAGTVESAPASGQPSWFERNVHIPQWLGLFGLPLAALGILAAIAVDQGWFGL